jgi:hypothetical protein
MLAGGKAGGRHHRDGSMTIVSACFCALVLSRQEIVPLNLYTERKSNRQGSKKKTAMDLLGVFSWLFNL